MDTHKIEKKMILKVGNNKTVSIIIGFINSEYGLNIENLRIRTRKRNIVEVRQMAIYLIRKHTDFPSTIIGKYFNGLDHATVLHSQNVIENLLSYDKRIIKIVDKFNNVYKNTFGEKKINIFFELVNTLDNENDKKMWIQRYINAF